MLLQWQQNKLSIKLYPENKQLTVPRKGRLTNHRLSQMFDKDNGELMKYRERLHVSVWQLIHAHKGTRACFQVSHGYCGWRCHLVRRPFAMNNS